MVVPDDPLAQKCGGVVDAAKATGGQTGEKIVNMLEKVALSILQKSVLNEETIIENGGITIYSKM